MRDITRQRRVEFKTPLIGVLGGWTVEKCLEDQGAMTFDVDSDEDLRLALKYADGIVLTGGGDIAPKRYGVTDKHPQVYGIDKQRDAMEFRAVKLARQRRIPIMGICRGLQVLNVAHGGTLHQHINEKPHVSDHWGKIHDVKLWRQSQLARSLNAGVMDGTSYHHQAVDQVGEGLLPIGWARDGTIEAIETRAGVTPYVLGVQFHPEMDWYQNDLSDRIFEHFVRIAGRKAVGKNQSASQRLTKCVPNKNSKLSSMGWHYDMKLRAWVHKSPHGITTKQWVDDPWEDDIMATTGDGHEIRLREYEAMFREQCAICGGEHDVSRCTFVDCPVCGDLHEGDPCTKDDLCAFPPCSNETCDPGEGDCFAARVASETGNSRISDKLDRFICEIEDMKREGGDV